MPAKRYRLKTATLSILDQNGDKLPLMIPSGAEVQEVEPLNETSILNVEWEGKRVLMFARDLLERGEPINPTDQSGAWRSVTNVTATLPGHDYSCNDPSQCSFTGPDGHIIGAATPNGVSAEIAAGDGPNAGGNVQSTVSNLFTFTSPGTGFVTVTFIVSHGSQGGNANGIFSFGDSKDNQTAGPGSVFNRPITMSQIPVTPGDYALGWHLFAQASSNPGEGLRKAFFEAKLSDIRFTAAPEPPAA